ncbi:hypothetical protein V6582_23020 [Agrobacterium vitis]|uniref:hypothetical protein n=1 Tax=Agrobacterium vitis TaxID=373 RepID=UPI0012E962E2|nr:hypothetical protein [Agrobacterium vitis]MVA25793.1 hypothetical protein [Agrobacterium vitis]
MIIVVLIVWLAQRRIFHPGAFAALLAMTFVFECGGCFNLIAESSLNDAVDGFFFPAHALSSPLPRGLSAMGWSIMVRAADFFAINFFGLVACWLSKITATFACF